MVNSFSRFSIGKYIENIEAETVKHGIYNKWGMKLGFPTIGFW